MLLIVVLLALVPDAKTAVPGTFFWKPRLGIDLAMPKGGVATHGGGGVMLSKKNIMDGVAVVIEGYQAGLTVAALAVMLPAMSKFPHFDPTTAYFYTNAYRWLLRYLSLVPEWVAGNAGNYMETHKVWRRRFHYMDQFVPQWLRHVLFFVGSDQWRSEEAEWRRWVKYAEPAFGKYYRYPSPKFNEFHSMRVNETLENLDISNPSL